MFIFEFYNTGRVVIKTKSIGKLELIFLEKHEIILGIKLQMLEPL